MTQEANQMKWTDSAPVLWMALLGAASGVVSDLSRFLPEFELFNVAVYPGLAFGAVVAFGLWRWGGAGWPGAIIGLLSAHAGWIGAVKSFAWLTDNADHNLYLGAMAAGAIGAVGTLLGGALGVRGLRRAAPWLATLLAGSLAGLLLVPELNQGGESFILMFTVWQAAVAAALGFGLSRPQEKP